MLNECEQPGLVQTLLLPEDLTLRHLPALNAAHRRLDFAGRNLSLSPVHEVNSQRRKTLPVGTKPLKEFSLVNEFPRFRTAAVVIN